MTIPLYMHDIYLQEIELFMDFIGRLVKIFLKSRRKRTGAVIYWKMNVFGMPPKR